MSYSQLPFDANGRWSTSFPTTAGPFPHSSWTEYITGVYAIGGTVDGNGTQILADAKRPGSPGACGARFWKGSGADNRLSHRLRFIFRDFYGGQGTRRPEVWVRYYFRYEAGFKWASYNSADLDTKEIYWDEVTSGEGNTSYTGFNGGNNLRTVNQGGGAASGDYTFPNGTPGWDSIYPGGTSDGSWHCLEAYMKVETSGQQNGVGRIWLNGSLVAEKFGVRWRAADATYEGWWHFAMIHNQKDPQLERAYYVDVDDVVVYVQTPPNQDAHGNPYIGLVSAGSETSIFFQDDFENDPSNWVCGDGQLSKWSAGIISCGYTDGFGYEWKMGPGRTGGNAVYSWKKSGVPNGYRSESNKWLSGADVKSEVYHRWYMKVPTAGAYDKNISEGFKFWRYITRENGYSNPPEIYLNAYGSPFSSGNLVIYNVTTGYKTLCAISEFNDDQWHCHELRIKLNSNGNSDGVIQYWLDGVLKVTHSSLSFSASVTNLAIHRFGVGVGNVSDSDWFQTEWSAIGFDEVVLSTEYIGLAGADPGPDPDPDIPLLEPDHSPIDSIFYEPFENSNWAERGWYDDNGQFGVVENNMLRWTWSLGDTRPNGGTTWILRKLLNENGLDQMFVRYYVYFTEGWEGSGGSKGPNIFRFLSNADGEFDSPNNSFMNLAMDCISEETAPHEIYAEFAIQDRKRVNYDHGDVPNDLTETTEDRSVGHCNGCKTGQDCGTHWECVDDSGDGNYQSNRAYHISSTEIPKQQWVKVEWYIEMNTIDEGIGLPNGILKLWVNDTLAYDSNTMLYRPGAYSNDKPKQLAIIPYMSAGSPKEQTMYLNELAVYDYNIKDIAAPTTYYEIEYGPVNGPYSTDTVESLSFLQTNLLPGTLYEARVRKYDNGAYSNWTGFVDVQTTGTGTQEQDFVDFSDWDLNVNPIGNGWTSKIATLSDSYIEQLSTPIGTKAWRIRGGLNQFVLEYTDGLSGSKAEVLILAKRSYLGTAMQPFVVARTEDGIYKRYSGGLRNHDDGTDYRLNSWENDTPVYQINTPHFLGNLTDQWVYVRTQFDPETNLFRTKAWIAGETEPTSWGLSDTFDFYTLPNGKMGFWFRGRTTSAWQICHIAYFSQGVGGAVAPMPGEPIVVTRKKILSVGDDITSGSSTNDEKANPTYRYGLYNFWDTNNQLDNIGFVGPFTGVGDNVEPTEIGGYAQWPLEESRHAGIEGATIQQLSNNIQSWVFEYNPDVILLCAWINSPESILKPHFASFIDNARAAKSDVDFIIGLPYYGVYSIATINQIRSYITEIREEKYTHTSRIFLVDLNRRWNSDRHAYGYAELDNALYPNTAGNERLSLRFQDGLYHYLSIGSYWTKPATPTLSISAANLMWDYDNKTDLYSIEYDGSIVHEQTGTMYSVAGYASGDFRVRGKRIV